MSYTQQDALVVQVAIAEDREVDLTALGSLVGDGLVMDLSVLRAINIRAVDRCNSGQDAETVELGESGAVYDALMEVPVSVRDDVGFWRWITIVEFQPFLLLRQGKDLKEAIGAGTNVADILAARMFLRARIARSEIPGGAPDYSLLTDLGRRNHDFLQSHIVRGSTGAETGLARAFIKAQANEATKVKTTDLREFVKSHISRPRLTIATFLMSEDEADDYLDTQREAFRG